MISNPICSQCGFAHPQVRSGEICPLVKDKTSGGKMIDFDPFIRQLKTIMASQIKETEIEEYEKFCGFAVVKFAQLLQEYQRGK